MTGELSMAAKKTSAEKAREDAENARVENMLDGAFGTLSGLEISKVAEEPSEEQPSKEEIVDENKEDSEILDTKAEDENITGDEEDISPVENEAIEEDKSTPPELPISDSEEEDAQEDVEKVPSGPPSKGPPSKPPSGPPSKGPPSTPPSGPPSKGPPSKPPSGPPSKGPPSTPPSGPPSKGPPSKPPSGLPSQAESEDNSSETVSEKDEEKTDDIIEGASEQKSEEISQNDDEVSTSKDLPIGDLEKEEEEKQNLEPEIEENDGSNEIESVELDDQEESNDESLEHAPLLEEPLSQNMETEAEIARLSAEVERLRKSMAGAAEVIEELENPPMPPAIMEDLVIGAHIVGDMARLARQLDREQLIRASMGTIAMLHPEQLEIIISTKHMSLLPRMDERDICAAKLGVSPPRGAPEDWRVLEVVLASVSLITGGPAAVIHSHGPFTTAASCEKDLVLVQPIDEIGKKHIGKIIIVDPDDENPEEFLRQVAEALQQGGMRCVVIRGKGAYAVGADLDQAWANAAMLEHSMKVVLLARQANLKV